MKSCINCKTQNIDSANFCKNCGHVFPNAEIISWEKYYLLEDQYNILRKQNSDITTRLEQSKKKIDSLNSKISTLDDEKKKLSIELKDNISKLTTLKNKSLDLQKELSNVKTKLVEVQSRKVIGKNIFIIAIIAAGVLIVTAILWSRPKSSNEDLTRQIISLKVDKSRLKKELASLKSSNDDLNNAVSLLEADKSRLKKELVSLKSSNDELRNKIRRLETTICNLGKAQLDILTPSSTRRVIRVDLNSSWEETSSPNSSYKAFRSFSNKGINSSLSSMSFEIKGYSSFTFYIDSYAETSCDYVMVGKLGQLPRVNDNYANTKGWQKPSTSFSNYKAVTYNNLDKTASYKIYVTYRKDNIYSQHDDRGYILLPKIAQ